MNTTNCARAWQVYKRPKPLKKKQWHKIHPKFQSSVQAPPVVTSVCLVGRECCARCTENTGARVHASGRTDGQQEMCVERVRVRFAWTHDEWLTQSRVRSSATLPDGVYTYLIGPINQCVCVCVPQSPDPLKINHTKRLCGVRFAVRIGIYLECAQNRTGCPSGIRLHQQTVTGQMNWFIRCSCVIFNLFFYVFWGEE